MATRGPAPQKASRQPRGGGPPPCPGAREAAVKARQAGRQAGKQVPRIGRARADGRALGFWQGGMGVCVWGWSGVAGGQQILDWERRGSGCHG